MKYLVEYLINAKCAVILQVVGMNCTCDVGGALLERVKITTLRIKKKIAPRSSQNHTAPLRTPQIYFRTIHFQDNLAAGAGQILLLAGQFWPAGRLLPTTDLDHTNNK